MSSQQLHSLLQDVRKTGVERVLKKEEASEFYRQFRADIAPVVEKIRVLERQAHEEAKHITLA